MVIVKNPIGKYIGRFNIGRFNNDRIDTIVIDSFRLYGHKVLGVQNFPNRRYNARSLDDRVVAIWEFVGYFAGYSGQFCGGNGLLRVRNDTITLIGRGENGIGCPGFFDIINFVGKKL